MVLHFGVETAELNGPQYPAHEAALVRVEHAAALLSPVYRWGHGDENALAPIYAARYLDAAGLSPAKRADSH